MTIKIGLSYPVFLNSFAFLEKDFNAEIILNPLRTNISDLDLILFLGGEDVDPRLYGQHRTYAVGINYERDDVERALFNVAYRNNIPMVGICRGCQLIHALSGGNLIQDITLGGLPTHLSNHPLISHTDHPLTKISDDVNSLHHQGVVTSGNNFKIISSYGNVVEAAENLFKPILTVQYHPEWHRERDKYFRFFLDWAEEHKKKSTKNIEMDDIPRRPHKRITITDRPNFIVDWNFINEP